MTRPSASEVAKRGPRRSKRVTLAGDLSWRMIEYGLELGAGRSTEAGRTQWPSPKYREDPVAFAEEIVGARLWSAQREILEAIRDHSRVAISGGRKVGKDYALAIAALWWFCSWPNARVVMTAVTANQIDGILWLEVKKLHARAGKCLACRAEDPHDMTIERPCAHSATIDGEPAKLARTGLEGPGFRMVSGHTAREGEAVAGVSGSKLLYILDEASGIPDTIHRAIRGNLGGGGKEVLISNPTRTEGFFFDAFHKHAQLVPPLYKTITISSESTPNVLEGRDVVDGLATREWIEEERREFGEDSPFFKIHVKGEFVPVEEGKIVSLHTILAAVSRWHDTPAEGRLFIGLDPAGPGGHGDETAWAARRGQKVLEVFAMRGLDEDAIAVHTLGFIAKHLGRGERRAIVLLDRSGDIGAKVWGAMLPQAGKAYELVGVQPSDAPKRQRFVYDRHRDELHANLGTWLRQGGAIPEDSRLQKDLHAPSWVVNDTRRMKATPKKDLVKALGRSPDRGDAVMLSVWEPAFYATSDDADESDDDAPSPRAGLSPYEGGVNPYGDGPSPYGQGNGDDPDE